MKPTDTKGALNYRTTRTFLYFLYCHFHYLLFCVLEHNVWTFWNALVLPEVSRMKHSQIYIYIHTKTHIALAHMHHKNTDSRSRRVRQQVICCSYLLCITWTRPAVNAWNIEAPFIFRALYRWQSCPNVTVFTKSLHFNVTIFILHIKRHEMCPKKITSKHFFSPPDEKCWVSSTTPKQYWQYVLGVIDVLCFNKAMHPIIG